MTASPTSPTSPARNRTLRPADYLACHRGGGLFTESVNQRVASYLCVVARAFSLPPTALTLLNLIIGLATSVSIVVLAPALADGDIPALVVGAVALLGWQAAYSLDCADGQLARATGQANPAGGRVDILADVAQQISLIAAVTTVAAAFEPDIPTWLVAAFTGTWMVNLVTSVLQHGTAAGSLIVGNSLPIRVVKLIRDYGAVITLVGAVLATRPEWTIWLMTGFTLVNGSFLLASIAAAARASLRR